MSGVGCRHAWFPVHGFSCAFFFSCSLNRMLLQMPVMWVAQLQMEMLACAEPTSSCLLVSRSATKVCLFRG